MPTYGDSKKRDMARSILPSTKRKGQEDRRRVHKSARTQERTLMGFAEDEWWEDEADDVDHPDFAGVERKRAHDTKDMVEMRRYKDKVGPFSRWAERVTKNLPKENRLSYLRALVPDTLIGEHAVSHVEWKDHFKVEHAANNRTHYRPPTTPVADLDAAWLCEQLVNDPTLHARLNRAIKNAHRTAHLYWADGRREVVGPTHPRTLKGLHDVAAFVADLHRANTPDRKVQRGDYDPKFHGRVSYGADAGAFWIPSGNFHPEWLNALHTLRNVRLAG